MDNKTDVFLEYKSLLFSVAYNMLGNIADAEDMVQETYLKWIELDMDKIEYVKAYLVKIITNKCINYLNRAKAIREKYIGIWLPEPLPDYVPDNSYKHAESYHALSIGILMLLERLTPQERAIFILREVFAYDYGELSGIFDKTEDNCRQIFKRAKENLGKDSKRFEADIKVHEKLLKNFMQACMQGNVGDLINLLKDDVVLFADGGGKPVIATSGPRLTAALKPIYGKENVAKFVIASIRRAFELVPDFNSNIVITNGLPSVLSFSGTTPVSLSTLESDGEKLINIYVQTNPDKLRQLRNF